MNWHSPFKKVIVVFFLSIFLGKCAQEQNDRFFESKNPADTFIQKSSNLYSDVYIQNSSQNTIRQTFSQNTIERVEKTHSQVGPDTNEEILYQNTPGPEVEEIFNQSESSDHSNGQSESSDHSNGQSESSTGSNAIDILWVIDNSLTMGHRQDDLAKNLDPFITGLLPFDFKMAVITTDSSVNRDIEGKLTSAEAQRDRTAFEKYFKEKIKAGSSGSFDEKGLLYSEKFFKDNSSWIRPNAYLTVIYFSDENDSSPNTIQHYLSKLQALKTDPKKLKVISIVITRGSNESIKGIRYRALSRRTNGIVKDINDSFDASIKTISANMSDLLGSSFVLSRNNIDPASIKVYVNSVLSPQNQWRYESELNTIFFDNESSPPANATIKVRYRTGRLLSSFPFTHPANAQIDGIKVFINNVKVDEAGWEYRDRQIHFKAGFVPEESAKIKITYNTTGLLTSFPLDSELSPWSIETIKVFLNDTRTSDDKWEYRDRHIHFLPGFVPEENTKIKIVYKRGELSTSFPLSTPIDPDKLSTAKVFVKDRMISRSNWEYRNISVYFKKNSVPSSKAQIKVEHEGSAKLFSSFPLRTQVVPSQIDVYVNKAIVPVSHWGYRHHAIHFRENHIPEEGARIKIVYRNEVALLTHFSLEHTLDLERLDTVDITVNGNPISRRGWEYRGSTNTIHFKEEFIPPEGATIRIIYTDL